MEVGLEDIDLAAYQSRERELANGRETALAEIAAEVSQATSGPGMEHSAQPIESSPAAAVGLEQPLQVFHLHDLITVFAVDVHSHDLECTNRESRHLSENCRDRCLSDCA